MSGEHHIPWQDYDEWAQVAAFISIVANKNSQLSAGLKQTADQILIHYKELSRIMDGLCQATCPECDDICCSHATVWYDFKDLLFLKFGGFDFPLHQIEKKTGPDRKKSCSHLTEKGCRLSRPNRPFVCTWYVCPAQNAYLKSSCPDWKLEVDDRFKDLKQLREKLENEFIRISSS